MTSRRRITLALAGLIILVVVGWLVRNGLAADSARPAPAPTVSVAPRHI
ncbi:MAG: hypothetical protein JOZ47_13480 [Kutzneria sp.]|nr:hypothetical protein [Kutzneria sp.]